MSKNDELKQTLLETLLDQSSSEQDKIQAQAALRKLSPAPAEPAPVEITGPTTIGNIVVSPEYAETLMKLYGNLGSDAAKTVIGQRQIDAAMMKKGEFLEKYPSEDNAAYYDDTVAKLQQHYSNIEAELLRLREEQEKVAKASRPIAPEPVPAVQQDEFPTPPVMGPAERALALRSLLGK